MGCYFSNCSSVIRPVRATDSSRQLSAVSCQSRKASYRRPTADNHSRFSPLFGFGAALLFLLLALFA